MSFFDQFLLHITTLHLKFIVIHINLILKNTQISKSEQEFV